MGFFGDILEKIGLGKEDAPQSDPQVPKRRVIPKGPPDTVSSGHVSKDLPPELTVPPPVDVVDVTAILERLAADNPQKLNWRTSIVDLLKLLDIDSSYMARKELAKELKCPDEVLKESAKMNIWLHKTVIARIAENGGSVPKELLD